MEKPVQTKKLLPLAEVIASNPKVVSTNQFIAMSPMQRQQYINTVINQIGTTYLESLGNFMEQNRSEYTSFANELKGTTLLSSRGGKRGKYIHQTRKNKQKMSQPSRKVRN